MLPLYEDNIFLRKQTLMCIIIFEEDITFDYNDDDEFIQVSVVLTFNLLYSGIDF